MGVFFKDYRFDCKITKIKIILWVCKCCYLKCIDILYHFMFEFAQKKNDEFWMYMKYKKSA